MCVVYYNTLFYLLLASVEDSLFFIFSYLLHIEKAKNVSNIYSIKKEEKCLEKEKVNGSRGGKEPKILKCGQVRSGKERSGTYFYLYLTKDEQKI